VSARSDRAVRWRCFHCDATFTTAEHQDARLHFGSDAAQLPACQMRLPGEHHLLRLLRDYELELAERRHEDTALHRALQAMSADHAVALRRAEEEGYAKAVADMKAQGLCPEPAAHRASRPSAPHAPTCAPAHPPQPGDAEVVEAVRRASLVFKPESATYRNIMRALAILRGEPDPAGGA
jgi:hypothetical protein